MHCICTSFLYLILFHWSGNLSKSWNLVNSLFISSLYWLTCHCRGLLFWKRKKGLFKSSIMQDFCLGPSVFVKPLNNMIQHSWEWKAGTSGKRWGVIYSVFCKSCCAFRREWTDKSLLRYSQVKKCVTQ